jgi:hypothetical protein
VPAPIADPEQGKRCGLRPERLHLLASPCARPSRSGESVPCQTTPRQQTEPPDSLRKKPIPLGVEVRLSKLPGVLASVRQYEGLSNGTAVTRRYLAIESSLRERERKGKTSGSHGDTRRAAVDRLAEIFWAGLDSQPEEPAGRSKPSWSGIRESNPRLDLGKVAYYHYTNPAEIVAHL